MDGGKFDPTTVKNVNSPYGLVCIVKSEAGIPAGWRKMTMEEGKKSKCCLERILEEWSVVGFQTGKLDGPGYGSKFSDNQEAVGEFFIVQNFESANAPTAGTAIGPVSIIQLNYGVPFAHRRVTLEEGKNIKNELVGIVGEWGVVAFGTGKLDGSGYGNKISDQYGPECGQMFIVPYEFNLGNCQNVETSLGPVAILNSSYGPPLGWRIMKITEGEQVKDKLAGLLKEWQIVAFIRGKFDGYGYGNKFSDVADAAGEYFIIR